MRPARRPRDCRTTLRRTLAQAKLSAFPSFGRRPRSTAPSRATQKDSHWHDYIQFYESLMGNTGSRLGANHQMDWTVFVAVLLDYCGPQAWSSRGNGTLSLRASIEGLL